MSADTCTALIGSSRKARRDTSRGYVVAGAGASPQQRNANSRPGCAASAVRRDAHRCSTPAALADAPRMIPRASRSSRVHSARRVPSAKTPSGDAQRPRSPCVQSAPPHTSPPGYAAPRGPLHARSHSSSEQMRRPRAPHARSAAARVKPLAIGCAGSLGNGSASMVYAGSANGGRSTSTEGSRPGSPGVLPIANDPAGMVTKAPAAGSGRALGIVLGPVSVGGARSGMGSCGGFA